MSTTYYLVFVGRDIKSKKILIPSASYLTTIVATARLIRAFCVIPTAVAILSSPSLIVSDNSIDCLGNFFPPHFGAICREPGAWHQLIGEPGAWHQLINLLFSLWKQGFDVEGTRRIPNTHNVTDICMTSKLPWNKTLTERKSNYRIWWSNLMRKCRGHQFSKCIWKYLFKTFLSRHLSLDKLLLSDLNRLIMNTNVSELNAIFNILNNPSLTCLRSRRWVRVWTYLSFSTSSNYYLKDTSLLLDTVGLTLTKQLDFKTTQFDIRRSINPNSSLVTNLTYTQALSLLGKTRETRAWHQLRNPGAWHQLINLLFSLWKQARVRCRYSPERFPLVTVPDRFLEPLFASESSTFYALELKICIMTI